MATCVSSVCAAFVSARWRPSNKYRESKKHPGKTTSMYYRLLPELKNAVRAKKDKVVFPFSKMDFAVLKVLADTGYLKSVEKETMGKKSIALVKLGKQGLLN